MVEGVPSSSMEVHLDVSALQVIDQTLRAECALRTDELAEMTVELRSLKRSLPRLIWFAGLGGFYLSSMILMAYSLVIPFNPYLGMPFAVSGMLFFRELCKDWQLRQWYTWVGVVGVGVNLAYFVVLVVVGFER